MVCAAWLVSLAATPLPAACGAEWEEYDAQVEALPVEDQAVPSRAQISAQLQLDELQLPLREEGTAASTEQLGEVELGPPQATAQAEGSLSTTESVDGMCVDADADGFSPSANCGNPDCDDTNPDCHAGSCCKLDPVEPRPSGQGG